MIIIKTDEEIEMMRRAGKKLARLLDALLPEIVKEGVNGESIEKYVLEYMEKEDAIPTFKGYNGYKYAINFSVNEEVVHGFPLKSKVLKNGDVVSIDCGLTYKGYIADSARTYIIGQVPEEEKGLVEATKESLYMGIKKAVVGNSIGDIGHEIQTYIESKGFSVIREYVGHGVGRKLHEDPQIPNYGRQGRGPKIKKNMTLAIEPMVSMGSYEVDILEDGWTAVTRDRSKAAHFEHTIAVTENGPEILTQLT
ncbi:type I methionyl aminopeptidase [Petrotoga olearia]|jgi:methionyl aminopeptidase|uniref:Methionine aminopeptidase n=2 Tax=Petrotoga olearia TaxID=156203 RepID=A0A2K1P4B0_9BACT|nr:type I methionyl aminopeptidase [Petrotoga olearia]KUK16012.1 MAG: Methionine aminopeptidase [Petrotoga mobilis]PNR97596.1 methionine aminopeptidase [Petrotoga olearia DSM 13574]RMA75329.1 methionyl aminopeptidase [Petrotoga olearia]HBT50959.1 type I methionyl aminopeptidase [Petrotoga sp.]